MPNKKARALVTTVRTPGVEESTYYYDVLLDLIDESPACRVLQHATLSGGVENLERGGDVTELNATTNGLLLPDQGAGLRVQLVWTISGQGHITQSIDLLFAVTEGSLVKLLEIHDLASFGKSAINDYSGETAKLLWSPKDPSHALVVDRHRYRRDPSMDAESDDREEEELLVYSFDVKRHGFSPNPVVISDVAEINRLLARGFQAL